MRGGSASGSLATPLKMRRSFIVFVTLIKLPPFRPRVLVCVVVVPHPFAFG